MSYLSHFSKVINKAEKKGTWHGYARASTDDQTITLEAQKEILTQSYKQHFEHTHRWGDIYVDGGISGNVRFKSRPASRVLWDRVERGDVIASYHIDRMFRKFADMVDIVEALMEMDVEIVFLSTSRDDSFNATGAPMKISPDDPISMMLVNMLGVFAQYERQLNSTRTREATHVKRMQGLPVSQNIPVGFVLDKAGYLQPSATARKAMDIALRMKKERVSTKRIQRHLSKKGYIDPRTRLPYREQQISYMIRIEYQLRNLEKCIADGLVDPDTIPPYYQAMLELPIVRERMKRLEEGN